MIIYSEILGSPPSPASVITSHMSVVGISQAELARAIRVSAPRLNMIIKNRLKLTTEIALKLAKVFDTHPLYWLRIRDEFDVFVESKRIQEELNSLDRLQKHLGYAETCRLAA